MTIHIKRSTDAGLGSIPMVGNTAGRFIAILDAILQDGYNTLTGVTATCTSTVATYTKTAHGFTAQKGQIVQVTGFTQTAYNVTGPISNVTANTWDMQLASTPSSDTGGTAKHAPCWGAGTKIFSGTNLASYKPLTGTRMVLGVDDAAGTATNARIRGFESMTAAGVAVASGTNPFPTDAQMSGGLYFDKSSTNDATARAWVAVSNGTVLYFFNQMSGLTTTGNGFAFGDFWSRKSGGDSYACHILGDITSDATTASCRITNLSTSWTATNGLYIARSYTGTAGSIGALRFTDLFRMTSSEIGAAGGTYPNPIEGGIVLCPIWLGEVTPANTARGTVPGLWAPAHARPLAHGDTFSGATGTALEGKTFEVFNAGSSAQICFETSDTWTAPL